MNTAFKRKNNFENPSTNKEVMTSRFVTCVGLNLTISPEIKQSKIDAFKTLEKPLSKACCSFAHFA